MAIPKVLMGSGLGSLGVGSVAAATGDENQTAKQRLGRGILGGMAGAGLGAGIHGGLRYNKLRKMDVGTLNRNSAGGAEYVTKKIDKDKALDQAFFGEQDIKSIQEAQSAANKRFKEVASAPDTGAAHTAKRTKELASAFENSNNMFKGMDPVAAKKMYRKEAIKYHPDRAGGDPEKFRKLQDDYEAFQAAQTMQKAASASISHLMYESFFKNLYL